MAAVQHGSTATHPDAGGLAGTREDGDLQGWTRVDVLPPDGMQEVSGSSPLSSTAQKPNSNESNSKYSRKVQQRRPVGPPYVCSDRHFPGLGLLAGHRIPGAEPAPVSLSPGKSLAQRSRDSCHQVTTRPSRSHSCQRLLPHLQVV